MSNNAIKLNVLVSYISQIYLIIANIVVLPIYIKYIGAESYGLVAFFLLLQGLFLLLDFGLTPTLSRQTTLFNAGSLTEFQFLQIFRFLSLLFYGVAIISGISLFILNDIIVYKWIVIEELNFEVVKKCFYIMIICIILRWLVGLYRGIIIGFEKIVWLGIVNIMIATLKFFGVLLYMLIFGFTIINFFIVQLIVGVLEFALFFLKSHQLLPKLKQSISLDFSVIKPLWPFTLSIGFTSLVWILVTQLDKFILSGILNLSDYGYFNLAVMVASAIIQISIPISNAIMPRMAFLYSENNIEQMRLLYLNATQIVTVFVVTLGLILAFFAENILLIWSNNEYITKESSDILRLYAMGNVFLVLASFPYYLQYAKGSMKYHLWGNILGLIILVPNIAYFAYHYGAIGAGWVWLITHGVFLFFWVSFVHVKIEPTINIQWFKSFLPSMSAVSVWLYLAHKYLPITMNDGRIMGVFKMIVISLVALLVAILFSDFFRKIIYTKIGEK